MVTFEWYDRRADGGSLADLLEERGSSYAQRAWAARERRGPTRPTVVARSGSQVIGYMTGHFDSEFNERFPVDYGPGQAWIEELYVSAGCRRDGVGSGLMRTFVAEALAHGCTYVACILDLSSDPAGRFAFFTSLGFEPLLPDDPTDAVCAPTHTVLERASSARPLGWQPYGAAFRS
jgi:GNAT superfamily N-acetyltransferase